MGRKLDLVRAQDHRLATLDELAQDCVVQQLVGDHGIDSRKGIVHQVHVTVLVGGAGKGQAGSLATTQVDPIAADLGRVAAWQLVQVGLKGARLNDLVIALFLSCKTYKFHYYIFLFLFTSNAFPKRMLSRNEPLTIQGSWVTYAMELWKPGLHEADPSTRSRSPRIALKSALCKKK